MKQIVAPFFLFVVLTSPALAEQPQTAKILAVKAHEQGRIAYWEGRVPIYDGYPLYDLTLATGKETYVVRYESLTGYFPSRWKVGSEVRVRPHGKGRFYLVNGSEDVPVEIVRGIAADCVLPSAPPVGPIVGPQVPCE